MAATYQSITSNTATSTTPTTTTPASTVAGDHLIWGMYPASQLTAPPAGFTAIPNGSQSTVAGDSLILYQKIADGTEGANLAGTCTSVQWACFAIRTTGTNCGLDVLAKGTNGDNGLATATIPALTTNFANEEIYAFQFDNGRGLNPYTPDAAFTAEIYDAFNNWEAEICHKTTTTAATYGSWVSTATGGTYPFAGAGSYIVLAVGENLAVSAVPAYDDSADCAFAIAEY
jgi:hypothetical protein